MVVIHVVAPKGAGSCVPACVEPIGVVFGVPLEGTMTPLVALFHNFLCPLALPLMLRVDPVLQSQPCHVALGFVGSPPNPNNPRFDVGVWVKLGWCACSCSLAVNIVGIWLAAASVPVLDPGEMCGVLMLGLLVLWTLLLLLLVLLRA